MLHAQTDQIIELYVYNTLSDVVRVVTLLPTYARGGRGLLGPGTARERVGRRRWGRRRRGRGTCC